MSLERFTIIQCSDFNILNRSEAGEDVDSVLDQRAETGFNYQRVWTAFSIDRIGRLVPRERPGIYDHMPVYADKAAQRGIYVEYTAGTGPWTGIFDTEDQKVEHWDKIRAASNGHPGITLELINEANNLPNIPWPINRCKRPAGNLVSRGSNIIDDDPVNPVWDIAGFHPGPDPRKVGHNAMERADIFGIPIWSGETVRYPDVDSNPHHAYDAAAAAALLCAGSCFHSVHGKLGELWSGVELECARAWTAGALSVPLEFQAGQYLHRSDLESDQLVRVYSRMLPDGRQHVVPIRVA